MYCRFRGAFTPEERKRIERAIATLDPGEKTYWVEPIAWLMMCATPAAETVYVAIRLSDGWSARASSVDELIAAVTDADRSARP